MSETSTGARARRVGGLYWIAGMCVMLAASSAYLTACGSDSSSSSEAGPTVLFSPEGNNLWAYDVTPPFTA